MLLSNQRIVESAQWLILGNRLISKSKNSILVDIYKAVYWFEKARRKKWIVQGAAVKFKAFPCIFTGDACKRKDLANNLRVLE